MEGRDKKTTTVFFDLANHSILRALRQELMFRIFPFGSFGGGPNLFFLARLMMLHIAGGLVCDVAVRGASWARLIRRITSRMRQP